MIPQKNEHVKCVLNNGTIVEGTVNEWSDNHVELLSLDRNSVLIIPNPKNDIMLIKIILRKQVPEPQCLENEFEEARLKLDPHDPNSGKTLAELKIELINEEKRNIAEKLKSHYPSAYKPSTTPYQYPSVITKSKYLYQPRKVAHVRDNKK